MADGRRPESALDRALAALDAGLQRSAEPADSVGDLTRCARCLDEPRATESEFCAGCRAYLLREELDVPVDADTLRFEVVLLDSSGHVTDRPAAAVLVPLMLLEVTARLQEVVREGQVLGLPVEHCQAVVDDEIERYRQTREPLRGLPDRVRCRLYHEGQACSCAGGRRRPCPLA